MKRRNSGSLTGPRQAKRTVTQYRETQKCSVLVRGLPRSCNQRKLRNWLRDCGEIKYVEVVNSLRDKTRLAKVTFVDHASVLSALTKKMFGDCEVVVEVWDNCTIWVTNYPRQYRANDLKQLLLKHDIVSFNVRLPSLRFNSNRRFAYIDLVDSNDCQKAVSQLHGTKLDNSEYELVAKVSNPLERTERTDSAIIAKREIFIRNLNGHTVSECQLNSIFSKYGTIESVRIPKSHTTPHDNECAFIIFTTRENALQALELNNTDLDGRKISVTISDSKPYLERQEIKNLLQHYMHDDSILSIYPIDDKVTKSQIRQFLVDNCSKILHDHGIEVSLDNIFLVTDHQGALVRFDNAKICAQLLLALNGKKLFNQAVHCGNIANLLAHNSKTKSERQTTVTKSKNDKIVRANNIASDSDKDVTTPSKPMTNDDFRKMFLGK